MLTAAIPALLVSASLVGFFDASSYSVVVFGRETLVTVVAAAATVSVAPFLIFLAYVVRIATVAKWTLSIGAFVLRETEDVAEVTWEEGKSSCRSRSTRTRASIRTRASPP